jgi:hypothetical protein
LAAIAEAIPPAPGRFSTMNCPPIRSETLPAISRVVTSAMPPAPKPTMMRTGLVGNCAAAAQVKPAAAERKVNVTNALRADPAPETMSFRSR